MIAILARAAAFVGIPPALIYLVVYGTIAALIGGSYFWVYQKGSGHARAECRTAELERVIYAQAQSIARYSAAVTASAAQRQEEASAARDREAVLKMRMTELEANDTQQEQAVLQLEADLHAAITDKEKADALIDKIRLTRGDCRATDRDIDVDQRMRRNKKPVSD